MFAKIICNCIVTHAQSKKWSLKDCIDYALEKNITVQQSKLDIESSKINITTSKGDFLPNLNAGVNHAWNTGLNTDPITNGNVVSTTQSTSLGINSNVTLYNGLRNIKELKKSKLNLLSNQYQLNNIKDNISINICLLYVQVLSNKEALKTLKSQYQLSIKDIDRTQELINSGNKPKGDLLEIEATLADQEKAIVEMNNNILISKISLFNLLNLNDFNDFKIEDEPYNLPKSDIMLNSPQEIFSKSLTTRNDIKISELAIEIANNNIKIAKGAYQPTLNAAYGFNTSYFTSELFNTPDFDTQFKNNKGHSFRLSLNIPIFNRLQIRNAVKISKLQLEISKLDLEKSKFNLKDKVYQAFNDTSGALKSYEASLKSLEARKLAYEYAFEKFNIGSIDSFTFNQSKTNYLNAENNVIKAKYDYIFKLKVLEFYFGVPIAL